MVLMRYSDCVCQLCGVSFNVPRIRRPDEDDDAAWGGRGYAFVTQQNAEFDCQSLSCEEDVRDHRLQDGEYEDRNLEDVMLGVESYCELEYTEHLAGPACTSTAGYTGYKISVQEMQHVISCPCLAEKRDGWTRGGVYQSGIKGLAPVRHGVSKTDIENDSPAKLGRDRGEMRALPMHPRCFELFQRVSLRCFGRVDIDGLWRLREEKGSYVNRFEGMPRNPDVELVSEEWYSARPGTEYLAADPIDVPGLSTLIQSCLTPRKKLDALRDELESELDSKGMSAIPPLRTWFSAELDKRAPKLRQEAEAEIQAGYENGMWQRKPANVLLGLRNRRRIWQDLEVIVRMISELDLTSDEE
ncbi:hypothetical protein KC343_g1476 [Hortaea werneckii]|nr:hypothetical protein KC352_g6119 [Hortaea werneckii]KAI7636043.1 hypothetical protein KC343_g1476 [Hortaea werneckii]